MALKFYLAIPYDSNFARLILGMRHWSTELLIDSAWLQVGPGDAPVKKYHSWGTGFFIGVALVKWGSHGASGTKVEAMLDCLRLEGSPSVAKTLILVSECIDDYRTSRKPQPVKEFTKSKSKLIINVNLTNVNLFALTDDNICLVSRVDTISLEKSSSKVGFVVSGFKLSDVPSNTGFYTCQRTEEMSSTFCFVKLARLDIETDVLSFQFLELVDLYWSPNLHLKCLTMIKELKKYKQEIQTAFKLTSTSSIKKPDSSKHWCVTFKGDTGVHLQLSEAHKLLFTFGMIFIMYLYTN